MKCPVYGQYVVCYICNAPLVQMDPAKAGDTIVILEHSTTYHSGSSDGRCPNAGKRFAWTIPIVDLQELPK